MEIFHEKVATFYQKFAANFQLQLSLKILQIFHRKLQYKQSLLTTQIFGPLWKISRQKSHKIL